MTVTRRFIPETIVPGKRLGRHVNHDSESLRYLHEDGTAQTTRWDRITAVLDQGDTSSCTGNACCGNLGTTPDYTDLTPVLSAGLELDEKEAQTLYSAAEVIDGDGPFPPNDNGSSGLSVAKAAKNAGLCTGYKHATSIAQAHTAIQAGPIMVGSNWYTSMDSPDGNGLVEVSGTIRGGHEYEGLGYDLDTDLWEFVNSWGDSYGVKGHFFMKTATLQRLLSEEGDVTSLVPLSQPAPVPTPSPEPVPPTPAPTPPPDPEPAPEPPSGALQWLKDFIAWLEK